MRTFLIGHRGVGKTTVLRALAKRGFKTLDLDDELERLHGPGLFERVGEGQFRALESEALDLVASHSEAEWIALGAGFSDWAHPAFHPGPGSRRRVVWLTRSSDETGRIFLNRPRLEPSMGPLEEFFKRRDERNAGFLRIADDIVELPAFWIGELTLPERLFDSRIELEPQIGLARRGERIGPPEWALEDGIPEGEFKILSSHRAGTAEDLARAGRDFPDAILKYAPPVETWAQLREGHLWARQDDGSGSRRAFLPVSPDGRWSWYRLWMTPFEPIAFLRDGMGTAADQPSIDAWIARRKLGSSSFAAVLGEGVKLSASPGFHGAFFEKWQIPYLAIEVRRGEWAHALPFLTELGLRFASVTSPLKLDAAHEVGASGSVNTLWCEGEGRNRRWHGCDTDAAGWEWVKSLELPAPVVLWGGQALAASGFGTPYSARTGKPRDESATEVQSPRTVIWGVPRSAHGQHPPETWKPECVLDLNYAENSPGKEFALERDVNRYIDGVEFFKAQAIRQQKVWPLERQ